MYLVFEWFGPGGLKLWVSLTVVAIFVFVWKTMRGNPLLKVIILLLAAASSAVYWAARPYLATYLLAAIFFFCLERYYREDKGKLWLLPVLMVIWVNSHGGYVSGFLILAAYLVDAVLNWVIAVRQNNDLVESKTKAKHLMLIGALMLAATLINPAGPGLWALPFTTVSRQAEQLFIAEWQSPDFHQGYLQPFAFMLVLLIATMGGTEKKFQIYELLLVAGFGLLGLYSVRNIFFFVIVAPALLTQSIEAFLAEWKKRLKISKEFELDRIPTKFQSGMNIAIVVLFSLLVIGRIGLYLPAEKNWEEISQTFPVAAVEYLQKAQPEGNLLTPTILGAT